MDDAFIVARDPIDTSAPEREADTKAAEASPPLSGAFGSLSGRLTSSARGFVDRHWHDDIMGDMHPTEKKLSPEEFENTYHLGPEHKITSPISEYSAASIADAVKKREAADMVWQRYTAAHSALTNVGVGMVGSMLDPIELGAMFVPGVGEERLGYALAKAGMGAKSTIIAAKAGEGATGAMIGTAATMPLRYVANRDELYDYTAREALTDLLYAAPFGAIMHAGVSPAIGAGWAKLRGVKPEPYFHDNYWPDPARAPEAMSLAELKQHAQMGVAEGVLAAEKLPPSFGHVDELARMDYITRHVQQSTTFAQMVSERPVDNTWLFPDHSLEARRIAPEAHAEWDRLQAEHNQLSAEHHWGKPPTPEEAASPEYKLEQELRERVKDILPVSWDLRVAADLQGKEIPPGGMAMFGGVTAEGQPKGRMAAIRMERAGERPENIWRETGWHKNPAGRWRFEINDFNAEFKSDAFSHGKDGAMTATLPLRHILDHPKLFEHYPHLKDLQTKIKINPNNKAEYQGWFYPDSRFSPDNISIYSEARTLERAKSTLLHEIQHSIQMREGDPWESSYSIGTSKLHPKYKEMVNDAIEDAKKKFPDAFARNPKWFKAQAIKALNYEIYLHNKTEIESRTVQERRNMNEIARKKYPPFTTYDVFGRTGIDIHNIVKRHMGTEIFDYYKYSNYLESDEFKARQAGIDERNARIRAALDERKVKVENGYEAADAKAKAAEEKARIAKEKLDAFMLEHGVDLEKQEKARIAAANAEADLVKANERLAKAKAEVDAYEKEAAAHQKEVDALAHEKEMAQTVLAQIEQERQARLAEEKRRNPSAVEQGMTDPGTRTAWISAMAKDPRLIAREESGHAIRASGLFKDEEWGILRDAAINKGWIDAMPKEVQDRYREAYADRGEYGVRDAMVEEAIMKRFAAGPEAWGPQGGVVARLMERIRNFLERVGNWLTSRGFQSAKDVFDAMESGKISSRETLQGHAARRIPEIEARMEQLKPTVLDAYAQAKAQAGPPDLPKLADAQRALWRRGFARAISDNELSTLIEHIYGPKKETNAKPTKPGELPQELQVQEQRMQSMIEEGYKPTEEEVKEHQQTQAALQEAMALEQGYQQAAECLIMAGRI